MLDAGQTGPSFLTREFIYRCPAALLHRRRRLALALSFVAPLLALAAVALSSLLTVIATLMMIGGLLLERWLFFAEAHHSVRAYYGAV